MSGDVIGPGLVELTELVGGVHELLAVARERVHVVRHVAFVLSDQLRRVLLGGEIDEIDVGVGAGARLDERQVTTVGRNLGDLPGRIVLEQQAACVILRGVAVQVECLRVALVRRDEEVLLVGGPAVELGLGFVARRQVARLAVRFAHEQVVDLVTAPIRREQRAPVGRKPGYGERRVGGRRSQRLFAFAGGGHCVQVEDAGFVRADEQLLVIGRPGVTCRHDVRSRSEKCLGVVLRRRGRGRRWRRCGGCRSRLRLLATAGEQQGGGQCGECQQCCRMGFHRLPPSFMPISYAILVVAGCLRDDARR
jgi:hypothetical protein